MHPYVRFSSPTAALSLAILIAIAPATALAGACPTCETNADCEALFPGEPAFCVIHDGDVGCGDLRQMCCPGQGCSTFSGRPSCEAAGTCTVVGTVETDAGTMASDAGATPIDSGSTPVDGGGVVPDATTIGTDAGSSDVASGGCSCRAGGGADARGSIIIGGLALVALALRRRRGR
ncbi:MAG: MYXO-CTERM sorting domain-containing protein [Myxococcota bacterium]|nr:MYXO-CTERM sorting domain-containing protein [Myxococcota bacterium]